jgi:hypothetical protein
MRNFIFVLLITALSLSGAVSVISPNGGEILLRGTQFEIKWYYNLPENIKIELFRNGSFFESIAGSLPNSGSYFWTVPQEGLIGSDFKVKISSVSNPGIYYDYSDNFFTIGIDPESDPVIKIISPVGGEALIIGDIASISWMDNIESKVKIELLQNDVYKTTLTDSTESDGTYEWPVTADLYGDGYKIKISSIEVPSLSDLSGSSFKIVPEGSITIISPNGGESYGHNGEISINWTDDISENVKIDLLKNGEVLLTIIESTPSDGSYLWTMPANFVSNNLSIRISSVNYSLLSDESDSYFEVFYDTEKVKILTITSSDWGAGEWVYDRRDLYNYDSDGKLVSRYLQGYNSSTSSFTTARIYNCTYFTDYYQLRYYYSYSHSGPYSFNSTEDIYKFSLTGVLLGRYTKETYMDSFDTIIDNTEKIFTYKDGLLDNIFDHFTSGDYNYITEESGFLTYFFYDEFHRVITKNYHTYIVDYKPAGEMLERTNWTYADLSAEGITEEIISEVWTNKSKVIDHYDENNRIRKEERYKWTGSDWLQYEADSLYYYDQGLLKRVVKFTYDPYTSKSKVEYAYDDATLDIEQGEIAVSEFKLFQNYPNPFNPVTTISYALPNAGQVELNVYNLNGQLVKSLVNGKMIKGVHKAEFNGADLTSGMYIYNLKVDGKSVQSKKMMMLK